ncbi:hypothetical protein Tco_0905786 [Tanacetum coccineum]
MTRVQHQQEVNEFIENVNQKTYAYGDVHDKNQDLLMTISKLEDKLKTTEKGKNVNTKFDKSMTLDKLIYVTLLNKNKELKAKMVSKVEVKTDKSKLVTSCSTPKNEQGRKKNANVIQIVLWIVDIGCSKHMTGNQKLLRNFIKKFIGTIRFRNDHFAGYGDYVQGNLTICHVYYVEGLRHNLFSVGQFCNGDLEVSFRSNTCYVRNLEGEDLLNGSPDSNLYTISISKMVASSPV